MVCSEVSSVASSTPIATTLSRAAHISQSISPGNNYSTPTAATVASGVLSKYHSSANNITHTAARPTTTVPRANISENFWSSNTTPAIILPTIPTRRLHTSNPQTLKTVSIWYSNDICEVYKCGPLCEPWLRDQAVFVDPPYTQEAAHSVLKKMLVDIRPLINETLLVPLCDVMFKEVLCRYVFPNCTVTETGQVKRARMCYESCARLIQGCGKSFFHFFSILKWKHPNLWETFNPIHVKLSDLLCSRELLPRAASNPEFSCLKFAESNDV